MDQRKSSNLSVYNQKLDLHFVSRLLQLDFNFKKLKTFFFSFHSSEVENRVLIKQMEKDIPGKRQMC